jgi:hypothetical protein
MNGLIAGAAVTKVHTPGFEVTLLKEES